MNPSVVFSQERDTMDSNSQSVASDNGDVKAAFRKPAVDSSGRKYRRYSPIRESPSDGSPKHADPELSHEDSGRIHVKRSVRNDDEGEIDRHSDRTHSHRYSDQHYSKSSYGYTRLDDYNRPEKHGDDERSHHRSSRSDRSRSRDHPRDMGKSRDIYDGAVCKSKNREREASFLEHHNKNRDSRRHVHPEDAERERHRSSKDHRGDGKYRVKESYRSELKEIAQGKKKYDDTENRTKNQHIAEPADHVDDCEKYDVASKKQKFSEKRVSKFTSAIEANVDESSTKPFEDGKMPAQVDVSEVANDVNAAKIAAMKAAELVNKNLVGGVGTGLMTADQKKKLLWGNKKAAAAEEPGHRWDNATFSDQERQEKFNKLMGLKGQQKPEVRPESQSKSDPLQEDKQRELQLELERQYTAGLRRRDGRTVGLGL